MAANLMDDLFDPLKMEGGSSVSKLRALVKEDDERLAMAGCSASQNFAADDGDDDTDNSTSGAGGRGRGRGGGTSSSGGEEDSDGDPAAAGTVKRGAPGPNEVLHFRYGLELTNLISRVAAMFPPQRSLPIIFGEESPSSSDSSTCPAAMREKLLVLISEAHRSLRVAQYIFPAVVEEMLGELVVIKFLLLMGEKAELAVAAEAVDSRYALLSVAEKHFSRAVAAATTVDDVDSGKSRIGRRGRRWRQKQQDQGDRDKPNLSAQLHLLGCRLMREVQLTQEDSTSNNNALREIIKELEHIRQHDAPHCAAVLLRLAQAQSLRLHRLLRQEEQQQQKEQEEVKEGEALMCSRSSSSLMMLPSSGSASSVSCSDVELLNHSIEDALRRAVALEPSCVSAHAALASFYLVKAKRVQLHLQRQEQQQQQQQSSETTVSITAAAEATADFHSRMIEVAASNHAAMLVGTATAILQQLLHARRPQKGAELATSWSGICSVLLSAQAQQASSSSSPAAAAVFSPSLPAAQQYSAQQELLRLRDEFRQMERAAATDLLESVTVDSAGGTESAAGMLGYESTDNIIGTTEQEKEQEETGKTKNNNNSSRSSSHLPGSAVNPKQLTAHFRGIENERQQQQSLDTNSSGATPLAVMNQDYSSEEKFLRHRSTQKSDRGIRLLSCQRGHFVQEIHFNPLPVDALTQLPLPWLCSKCKKPINMLLRPALHCSICRTQLCLECEQKGGYGDGDGAGSSGAFPSTFETAMQSQRLRVAGRTPLQYSDAAPTLSLEVRGHDFSKRFCSKLFFFPSALTSGEAGAAAKKGANLARAMYFDEKEALARLKTFHSSSSDPVWVPSRCHVENIFCGSSGSVGHVLNEYINFLCIWVVQQYGPRMEKLAVASLRQFLMATQHHHSCGITAVISDRTVGLDMEPLPAPAAAAAAENTKEDSPLRESIRATKGDFFPVLRFAVYWSSLFVGCQKLALAGHGEAEQQQIVAGQMRQDVLNALDLLVTLTSHCVLTEWRIGVTAHVVEKEVADRLSTAGVCFLGKEGREFRERARKVALDPNVPPERVCEAVLRDPYLAPVSPRLPGQQEQVVAAPSAEELQLHLIRSTTEDLPILSHFEKDSEALGEMVLRLRSDLPEKFQIDTAEQHFFIALRASAQQQSSTSSSSSSSSSSSEKTSLSLLHRSCEHFAAAAGLAAKMDPHRQHQFVARAGAAITAVFGHDDYAPLLFGEIDRDDVVVSSDIPAEQQSHLPWFVAAAREQHREHQQALFLPESSSPPFYLAHSFTSMEEAALELQQLKTFVECSSCASSAETAAARAGTNPAAILHVRRVMWDPRGSHDRMLFILRDKLPLAQCRPDSVTLSLQRIFEERAYRHVHHLTAAAIAASVVAAVAPFHDRGMSVEVIKPSRVFLHLEEVRNPLQLDDKTLLTQENNKDLFPLVIALPDFTSEADAYEDDGSCTPCTQHGLLSPSGSSSGALLPAPVAAMPMMRRIQEQLLIPRKLYAIKKITLSVRPPVVHVRPFEHSSSSSNNNNSTGTSSRGLVPSISEYSAPETFLQHSTPASDVWSCGLIYIALAAPGLFPHQVGLPPRLSGPGFRMLQQQHGVALLKAAFAPDVAERPTTARALMPFFVKPSPSASAPEADLFDGRYTREAYELGSLDASPGSGLFTPGKRGSSSSGGKGGEKVSTTELLARARGALVAVAAERGARLSDENVQRLSTAHLAALRENADASPEKLKEFLSSIFAEISGGQILWHLRQHQQPLGLLFVEGVSDSIALSAAASALTSQPLDSSSSKNKQQQQQFGFWSKLLPQTDTDRTKAAALAFEDVPAWLSVLSGAKSDAARLRGTVVTDCDLAMLPLRGASVSDGAGNLGIGLCKSGVSSSGARHTVHQLTSGRAIENMMVPFAAPLSLLAQPGCVSAVFTLSVEAVSCFASKFLCGQEAGSLAPPGWGSHHAGWKAVTADRLIGSENVAAVLFAQEWCSAFIHSTPPPSSSSSSSTGAAHDADADGGGGGGGGGGESEISSLLRAELLSLFFSFLAELPGPRLAKLDAVEKLLENGSSSYKQLFSMWQTCGSDLGHTFSGSNGFTRVQLSRKLDEIAMEEAKAVVFEECKQEQEQKQRKPLALGSMLLLPELEKFWRQRLHAEARHVVMKSQKKPQQQQQQQQKSSTTSTGAAAAASAAKDETSEVVADLINKCFTHCRLVLCFGSAKNAQKQQDPAVPLDEIPVCNMFEKTVVSDSAESLARLLAEVGGLASQASRRSPPPAVKSVFMPLAATLLAELSGVYFGLLAGCRVPEFRPVKNVFRCGVSGCGCASLLILPSGESAVPFPSPLPSQPGRYPNSLLVRNYELPKATAAAKCLCCGHAAAGHDVALRELAESLQQQAPVRDQQKQPQQLPRDSVSTLLDALRISTAFTSHRWMSVCRPGETHLGFSEEAKDDFSLNIDEQRRSSYHRSTDRLHRDHFFYLERKKPQVADEEEPEGGSRTRPMMLKQENSGDDEEEEEEEEEESEEGERRAAAASSAAQQQELAEAALFTNNTDGASLSGVPGYEHQTAHDLFAADLALLNSGHYRHLQMYSPQYLQSGWTSLEGALGSECCAALARDFSVLVEARRRELFNLLKSCHGATTK